MNQETRTHVGQIRDTEERLDSLRRGQRWIGAVVAVLVVGVAALVWYSYDSAARQSAKLTPIADFQQGLTSVNDHAKEIDQKLLDQNATQDSLRTQLEETARELRSRMSAVTKDAGNAASLMATRIRRDLDEQLVSIRTRLTGLESSRETDRTQIAALQQELTSVRAQMTRQSEELAAFRNEMSTANATLAANAERTDRNAELLRTANEQNRRDLKSFQDGMAMARIPFELTKNHMTEVTPGISVQVTSIDVPMHRISGYMWVLPDRRTVRFQKHGAQAPVEFYSTADGKRREMVVTAMGKNFVRGYVLVPAEVANTRIAGVGSTGAAE
jgi:predicted  nucleic acid-binding Zn-ribbon protein